MTEGRQRLARIIASLAIVSSASTLVIIVLLRLRWLTFHDDSLGYHALGFILVWMVSASLLGVLLATTALILHRQSRIALAGLVCAIARTLSLLARQIF